TPIENTKISSTLPFFKTEAKFPTKLGPGTSLKKNSPTEISTIKSPLLIFLSNWSEVDSGIHGLEDCFSIYSQAWENRTSSPQRKRKSFVGDMKMGSSKLFSDSIQPLSLRSVYKETKQVNRNQQTCRNSTSNTPERIPWIRS